MTSESVLLVRRKRMRMRDCVGWGKDLMDWKWRRQVRLIDWYNEPLRLHPVYHYDKYENDQQTVKRILLTRVFIIQSRRPFPLMNVEFEVYEELVLRTLWARSFDSGQGFSVCKAGPTASSALRLSISLGQTSLDTTAWRIDIARKLTEERPAFCCAVVMISSSGTSVFALFNYRSSILSANYPPYGTIETNQERRVEPLPYEDIWSRLYFGEIDGAGGGYFNIAVRCAISYAVMSSMKRKVELRLLCRVGSPISWLQSGTT